MTSTKTSRAAEIRGKLDYPIVDGDGHVLEVTPVFVDYIRETMGDKAANAYTESPSFRRYYEPWAFGDQARVDSWIPQQQPLGRPHQKHAGPRHGGAAPPLR